MIKQRKKRMKKFFMLSACVSMLFAACSVNEEQPLNPTNNDQLLYASLEGQGRTYVEEDTYLRWHEDDRLTAFYGNTMNRQYKFNGKTGDNSGSFSHVPSGDLETGNTFDRIYALYPYDETATITEEGVISLTLPAEQQYAENSFGKGANTMIAVSENLEDDYLMFRNTCGYLKLKFYSPEGEKIKSIEVKGNNNEKIAGSATATIEFGEVPMLHMKEDALSSIALDCEDGVILDSSIETATEFWVVIPEITFEKGITITITDVRGFVFEQTTSNPIIIERNSIQPMEAVKVVCENPIPSDQIWYTAKSKISLHRTDTFGVNIISNTFDATTGRGIITFGAEIAKVGTEAFYECYSLMSVAIPNSVKSIEMRAFKGCVLLESVLMSNAITSIGESAFESCGRLTNVVIPPSVSSVGRYAFSYCSNLTKIIIPENVTRIEREAFSGCTNLTSIYCRPTNPPAIYYSVMRYNDEELKWGVFPFNTEMKIYVPRSVCELYMHYSSYANDRTEQTNWSVYTSYIEPYDFE